MTASENIQNEEPGRPVWAAGLDLSPERPRSGNARLMDMIKYEEDEEVLRRLADAEMRVTQLEAVANARLSKTAPIYMQFVQEHRRRVLKVGCPEPLASGQICELLQGHEGRHWANQVEIPE